ncbi:hypothetical protein IV203_003053 [Nitzschia inconspicua]|uniref:Uncharacterized protein n=1 Tax=Nitzschia inconspicua TaxID=303405 RepID=A0A9K3PNC9_9STRA|nr:hypothetical protein IV203_003053 [Nitzschia inconspicua]
MVPGRNRRNHNRKLIRTVFMFVLVTIVVSATLKTFWYSASSLNYDTESTLSSSKNGIGNTNNDNNNQARTTKSSGKILDAHSDLTINVPGKGPFPSAKTLLTSEPPFEDSNVIKLQPDLIQSPNTVVTGYFRVRSKYDAGKYNNWMSNMLSLQDAMVIFTHADLVDQIKDMRKHALERTVVIPLALDELPIGTLYPASFWEDQLERDPEKNIHRSYQLFWIWLSKSWCVTQAIRLNPFQSDLFVWSDIGCFRNKKYNNKTMILHRENVPPTEILQMAHHLPNPPDEELFNDKYNHKTNFYHSGSQLAGYKDTWIQFHERFLETIDRFLEKNMIIVEDQAVLQSTCLSYPKLCAYVPFDQVKDNNYFGLRFVLHNERDFKYWRHPKATVGV